MRLILYISVSLLLVVLQTAVIPHIHLLKNISDIPLLLVIYVGLRRPLRESLSVALIFGLVMDGLSASPVGLYAIAYFWICCILAWLMTFFHIRSTLLLPIIYGAAALLEDCIFLASILLSTDGAGLPKALGRNFMMPVIWFAVLGPFFGVLMDIAQNRLVAWHDAQLVKKSGYHPV